VRVRAAATAAAAALIAAGCGAGQPLPVQAPPAQPKAPPEQIQAANGPIVVGPGPSPLAVKLDAPDVIRMPFHQPPRAGLLFDLDTGRVLWRRNPTRILPIASLTKTMTALLVVANERPRTLVRITREARNAPGSRVGLLPKRKPVRVEPLLYGLLLPSGNDAAHALAQAVSGSSRSFVVAMNARAQQMNLGCTHYTSVDGYVDAGNHSCAIDLAALARAVLDQPRLARIVGTRSAILRFPTKGGKLYLFNNNPLLRTGYAGTIGVKTGYTDAAGHCLVAAVHRSGHRLGVVLLHSPDTNAQARKLLDRGFRVLRAGGSAP
jgi:serine-type D-Ala-D-Ala carboxypeptidase (penicillin-binding protein 5/6)